MNIIAIVQFLKPYKVAGHNTPF